VPSVLPRNNSGVERRRSLPWWSVFFLSLIVCAVGISSCVQLAPPPATAVNPETFPQPIVSFAPAIPSELPPPVTENHTFVTIDGVPQYRIGPGDVLELFLTRGPTQERLQIPVRANGRISISFVEVSVQGLTADQAATEIAGALTKYYRNPSVDVLVKEYNSKKVSVLGAVGGTPRGGVGTIPLTGRTTLLELIAKAGGLAPNASLERIRITRESGKAYSVNLYQLIQEGNLTQEFILDTGDVVFVPERVPGEERRVFLLGEVRAPGPVPFYSSLTLGQLMAQAGGWTDGALFEEARIIRGDLNKPEIIQVDLGRLVLNGDRRVDQFLRPNDIVYVPRTRIANWNAFLAQLRPTLDFLTAGVQPFIIYQSITK
jgi:polysaccharide export outer membrane protein